MERYGSMERQAAPGAYSPLNEDDDNVSDTTFDAPEQGPPQIEDSNHPYARNCIGSGASIVAHSIWQAFIAYLITPLRNFIEWVLMYKRVYVLSVHDFGTATQSSHDGYYRPADDQQQHRIMAIFASEREARVAMTEVLASPDYAGRVKRIGFPQLEKEELGVLITSSSQMVGGAGGGQTGCAEVVVLVQEMFVRKQDGKRV